MLLRAAIVEDEPLAAQLLHRWLAESPDTAIVGSADSLPSAQTMIEQCSIDVLLLDINLAGEDGFCLAEAGYRQNLFEIIFVSAHAYYALPAFRVDAVDFLRKPFSRAQLFEALERVRRRIDSRRRLGAGKLRIRDGDSLKLVPCAAIQWIESAGGYSVVHTREQRHITREPLARLITQLGEGFARITGAVCAHAPGRGLITQDLAVGAVVIDDQHAQAAHAADFYGFHRLQGVAHRYRNGKTCAFAGMAVE